MEAAQALVVMVDVQADVQPDVVVIVALTAQSLVQQVAVEVVQVPVLAVQTHALDVNLVQPTVQIPVQAAGLGSVEIVNYLVIYIVMAVAPVHVGMPVQGVPMPARVLALLVVPDTAMAVQAVVAVNAAILAPEVVVMFVQGVLMAALVAVIFIATAVLVNAQAVAPEDVITVRVPMDALPLVAETATMAATSVA